MWRALTDVILPVVLIAGLGTLLGRRFTLDQQTLNKIQLYALVPALAFSSLMKTTVAAAETLQLGVAFLLVTLAIAALAWLVGRTLPSGSRGAVLACAVIGNNGNFGLPIALLALGQAGLDQAVVLFVFSILVMWTVGPAVLGSHGGPRAVLWSIGRMPTIWAVLIAGTLRVTGLRLPTGVMSAIDIVGAAGVPMVLMGLGIQLSTMGRIHLTRPVLVATGLRVVALPLVAWGIGHAVGLAALPLQSLVLACAMPTAVNVLMIAMEYDADVDTVASAVALSTFASIATLALIIANLPALA